MRPVRLISWTESRTRVAQTVAAVLLVVGLPAPARAQAPEAGKAVAQRMLHDGNALLDEGRAAEALEKFNQAYLMYPSPKLHYNIGQAQSLIPGHEAAAYEAMSRFLDEAKDANPELRAAAQKQREQLRAKVGLVTVAADPPDADLLVDDASVGKRAGDARLVLGIGTHKLSIQKDALVSPPQSLTIAGGDSTEIKLRLAPFVSPPSLPAAPPPALVPPPVPSSAILGAAAASPAANVVAVQAAPPSGSGSWTWQRRLGVGLGAVAAASLIFGIVEHVNYFSTADDFRNDGCGTNNLAVGQNCKALDDQFRSAETLFIVGYAGAAALGAAGAYFFWVAPARGEGASDGHGVAAGELGVTLKLQGRF